MSVPFLSITCDTCSFSGSSLVTFGRFLWKYEGKTFDFDRQMGLCRCCQKIVAMEHFPEGEVMGRAKEIRATYTGDPLFRYLEKDEAKYLASQDGFDVLEKVLALGRLPVCLDCGSSDIEPLKVPEGVGFKTDVPVDLGIGHPGCDGRLMVEGCGGMRIALRPKTRVYDIYGQLLTGC